LPLTRRSFLITRCEGLQPFRLRFVVSSDRQMILSRLSGHAQTFDFPVGKLVRFRRRFSNTMCCIRPEILHHRGVLRTRDVGCSGIPNGTEEQAGQDDGECRRPARQIYASPLHVVTFLWLHDESGCRTSGLGEDMHAVKACSVTWRQYRRNSPWFSQQLKYGGETVKKA
jgi:hypothetical protein